MSSSRVTSPFPQPLIPGPGSRGLLTFLALSAPRVPALVPRLITLHSRFLHLNLPASTVSLLRDHQNVFVFLLAYVCQAHKESSQNPKMVPLSPERTRDSLQQMPKIKCQVSRGEDGDCLPPLHRTRKGQLKAEWLELPSRCLHLGKGPTALAQRISGSRRRERESASVIPHCP